MHHWWQELAWALLSSLTVIGWALAVLHLEWERVVRERAAAGGKWAPRAARAARTGGAGRAEAGPAAAPSLAGPQRRGDRSGRRFAPGARAER